MKRTLFTIAILVLSSLLLMAQNKRKTPIMGWSSWNHFSLHISEDLIKEQADAMVATGMADVGYEFINIDDGFFGGRDDSGRLISHPEKFPNGMRTVSDYIHSKGLKAGIYSDAGHNTCICYSADDQYGLGAGLYKNEESDLRQLLVDWDYDFIKVDWCGGKRKLLCDKKRYSLIGNLIKEIKPEVIYNVVGIFLAGGLPEQPIRGEFTVI